MANISKFDPGQELSSLNFGNLIGGPLSAVVEAQILAANATVDYIKNVGFDENGDPNYVTFTYPKEIAPYKAGTSSNLSVSVDNKGSNYNVIPDIKIIGNGFNAVAEARVSDKELSGVIVTNQGQNYTQISNVIVLTPKGKDASFIIKDVGVNGEILEVEVTNQGSEYTHPPVFKDITSTDGQGAVLEAEIDVNGHVIGVYITEKGIGYKKTNKVNMDDPVGSGATCKYVFSSGIPSQAAQFLDMKLDVPLLTMVPIPYIRVEETTINFNAKINSVEKINSSQDIDASFGMSYENERKYSGTRRDGTAKKTKKKTKYKNYSVTNYSGKSKTKFNVSASFKRKDSRGTEIEKTYTMGISVKAVQDEIPAGMERVLGILENAIISQPSS